MSKLKEAGKSIVAAVAKILESGLSITYRRTVTLNGKPAHEIKATVPIRQEGAPPDETE